MGITIQIDGREVPFKSSGGVPKRYMMQFQRDLLKDVLGMGIAEIDLTNATESTQIEWIRDNINFDMFYDIAWVYAKTADPSIPEPLAWLESFDEFPIMEILPELQELLTKTVGTKR